MKSSTKGLLIAGGIVVVALIILSKTKKKKNIRKEICVDKDFWDGYYYENPEAGEAGHRSSRPVGDEILLYRKDYKKRKGEWVWINPLDKKDIDTTLDDKSVAELEREEICRKKKK